MSKLLDLTGNKYGRLTVMEKDNERITKSGSYWICKCECGKTKSIKSSSLRRGEIVSCGCYRMEKIMATKEEKGLIDDLTGEKFGYLTVLSKAEKRAHGGAVMWNCLCDCGNPVTVRGNSLKDKTENRTVSCGCKYLSIGANNILSILQKNNYQYILEYTFTNLPKYRFDFAIIKNEQVVRLIEFDGEQHYQEVSLFDSLEDIQKRDKIKNKYALAHNIPLVRIPYWERDKITLEMIMGNQYLITSP